MLSARAGRLSTQGQSIPEGGGGAALNILNRMCEFGVSKQTHIE